MLFVQHTLWGLVLTVIIFPVLVAIKAEHSTGRRGVYNMVRQLLDSLRPFEIQYRIREAHITTIFLRARCIKSEAIKCPIRQVLGYTNIKFDLWYKTKIS